MKNWAEVQKMDETNGLADGAVDSGDYTGCTWRRVEVKQSAGQ